jgi:hypothetical protein
VLSKYGKKLDDVEESLEAHRWGAAVRWVGEHGLSASRRPCYHALPARRGPGPGRLLRQPLPAPNPAPAPGPRRRRCVKAAHSEEFPLMDRWAIR